MKSLEKNQGVVLTILLVIGGIFVYRTFFATPIDPTLVAPDITTQGPGKDVVDLYQSLQSVTLDTSLFSSPGYRSLVDFTTPISPQPIGRRNPFDKISP